MTKSSASWKQALSQAFTKPEALFAYLALDPALLPAAIEASRDFSFKVPRGFAARMKKGDIHDPLLKQVLPLGVELQSLPGYSPDPLNENASNPLPGLLHKYQGRVLFITSGTCAINCRYCFRRHFPYEDNNPGKAGWEQVLAYIARDPSIDEVILSGGDPLVNSDTQLGFLMDKLAAIPHVSTVRLHTRLPIVLPERITPELVAILQHPRLKLVVVLHSNHANEIDEAVRAALKALQNAGIVLLNQTVLLRGINHTVPAQTALHKTLFASGVLPYYLHLLDPVAGAAHFQVAEAEAKVLMRNLQKVLPGYLLPKLAKEVPGFSSKALIGF